ncbi:MAG TPA: PIN domain-containing protein [Tepidiformaceae bacterium]|nr:PIN domain-containing protein [Tepidiformaceae bacterium]
MLNLDTHILLDAVSQRPRPAERRILNEEFWCISDIVLWEIGWLHREGRISLSLNDSSLNRALERMTIWPISREVAMSMRLLDFRSDPADEIIAATSLAHGIPLLTRDNRLLASKLVPLALT